MSDTQRDIFADEVQGFIETTAGMSFIPGTAQTLFEAGEYEDLKLFMNNVMLSMPDVFGFEGE